MNLVIKNLKQEINLNYQTEFEDIQKTWFLGSEEFLWNSGIEMRLPKMERVIKKDDKYFTHRLSFGGGGDETNQFYVSH